MIDFKVPVIVPVRNLSWMTINFLESLKQTTLPGKLWVIIVDSGSDDGEVGKLGAWLLDSGMDYLHLVRSESLGFVRAVNLGIGHAVQTMAPCFFIANNDTMCTDGWMERMVETLSKGFYGIVGCMSTSPAWRESDQAKYMVEHQLKYFQLRGDLEGMARPLRQNLGGHVVTTDFASFFFVGMSSDMVQQVGILDERYGGGLYDDDDYCFRAIKMGWHVGICRDVFIHHYHHSTFVDSVGMDKYMEDLAKNRKLFTSIHGVDPWEHRGIK